MKKEVSPIIALVGILVALTVVQALYWRGLLGQSAARGGPAGGGRAGGRSAPGPPAGLPGAWVSTLAGEPEAGFEDGAGEQARFDGPAAVAVDGGGTVYVADSRNHVIRAVSANGEVRTLAGKAGEAGYVDGVGGEARFSAPAGVAPARDGRVLVADTGNHRIRAIGADGLVTTYAGAETPRDDLGRPMGGYREGPTGEAEFCYPVGLAVDEAGVVYVADAGNQRVRRISLGGQVSTIPTAGEGALKAPTQVALGSGGELWVSDASARQLWRGPCSGPLRLLWRPEQEGTEMGAPAGVAAGRQGGVYVADARNHCIWEVRGDRTRVAAGRLEASEPGWADGAGDEARFWSPAGLAAGPGGELYVADFGNNCVRRLTLRGDDEEGS